MRIKGRILAGVAMGPMTANERRLGRYIRDGEGHQAGGGSGAAGLLEDEAGGGGGGDGTGGGAADGAQGGDGGAAADIAWASGVSADKGEGDDPSNLDWLRSSGVKDLNGLVKVARDNIKAVRDSGRVKIPGEGAKPEEIKAYREAIGVPNDAAGYVVELPQVAGQDGQFELDSAFLDPMRKIAHETNVPASAFKALAAQFITAQMEGVQAEIIQRDTAREDKVKEWGANAAANKADFRRGAQLLGLDTAAIGRLQNGDVGLLMDTVAKAGALAGEDFFADGERQNFGVTSEAEAQAELDRMTSDKDVYAKIKAKDATTVQKYNRLTAAVASFRARKAGSGR